ncbi:uncharacterized protein [Misgurnus anguillicaudatus]|uniref:uncharacterized protein n=1 Tax=Misgurnus anguillicaudatus TaxID=75329 RepID=UPI003CCFD40B
MSLCFILLYISMQGVNADEMKSVTEGDSVTLHTDITQIQKDDQILWRFGPKNARIAEIYKQSHPIYDDNNGIFKGKLQLDTHTGSLTITNISITQTGVYKLTIINSKGKSYKTFRVSVYARLPVPVISSNSSQCSSSSSSSKCVLLCSVLNVTDVRDVSLSWYKGNSLLSSISVSDLNIRLSLPLEVEYQDTNTYSCVLNNTITNQTQHLNISDVYPIQCFGFTEAVIRLVISALIGVATVAILVDHFRSIRREQKRISALSGPVRAGTQYRHFYIELLSVPPPLHAPRTCF